MEKEHVIQVAPDQEYAIRETWRENFSQFDAWALGLGYDLKAAEQRKQRKIEFNRMFETARIREELTRAKAESEGRKYPVDPIPPYHEIIRYEGEIREIDSLYNS